MFWRSPRPQRPTIPRDQALAMIPVRNVQVRESRGSDGLVLLTYPLAVKPWFGRLAERVGMWDGRPMRKQVQLDEMGTFVWDRLDGVRSVQRVAEELAGHYQLQPREAELSVTAFVRTIGQRGIIGLRDP